MNKNLIPVGVVWVGLSLVIGLVIVFTSPSFGKNAAVGKSETKIIREVNYVKEPAKEGSDQAKVQVNIEGTNIPGKEAQATVKIVK